MFQVFADNVLIDLNLHFKTLSDSFCFKHYFDIMSYSYCLQYPDNLTYFLCSETLDKFILFSEVFEDKVVTRMIDKIYYMHQFIPSTFLTKILCPYLIFNVYAPTVFTIALSQTWYSVSTTFALMMVIHHTTYSNGSYNGIKKKIPNYFDRKSVLKNLQLI